MRHIISEFSVTVIAGDRTYSITSDRAEFSTAVEAARSSNEELLKKLFNVDPLIEPLMTFGGHFDEDARYFVKCDGVYWKAPRKGVSESIADAHPYSPTEIRAVVGPNDKVELIRASNAA